MDELMITNFLEKNYSVKTYDNYFAIDDLFGKKNMTTNVFYGDIKKIFGEFVCDTGKNSLEVLQEWFDYKKKMLTVDLTELIEKLDLESGSVFLLPTLKAECQLKFKGKYHDKFVEKYFVESYKMRYLIPELKKYISGYNLAKGSETLTKDFEAKLEFENQELHDFALDFLNKWYFDEVLREKLVDFLNQLVITLGTRNWLVTWVGHGPLNQKKMMDYFGNESDFNKKQILKMYDEWYTEAVILASERMLHNNSYGRSFPHLNHPNYEL